MKHYDDDEKGLPQWVILSGTAVPDAEGVDMGTGATEGFYNPTNPDNANLKDKAKLPYWCR